MDGREDYEKIIFFESNKTRSTTAVEKFGFQAR